MYRRGFSFNIGTPYIYDTKVSDRTFFLACLIVHGIAMFTGNPASATFIVVTIIHMLLSPFVVVFAVDWLFRNCLMNTKAHGLTEKPNIVVQFDAATRRD